MRAPSVSVALATYNGERFIGPQLLSILEQTEPPNELVIADDGSTDRTIEIIRDVFAGCSDTQVALRVLPGSDRLGVAGNFERALAACSGELIALSDQDDVWHVNRLSSSTPAFQRDPELLLQHSDARLTNENGESLGVGLFESLGVTDTERALIRMGNPFHSYIRRNLVTGATTVLRRSLLDLAAPFPPEWVHDEWLGIIASAYGRVEMLNLQLIDYRQHAANLIGAKERTLSYKVRRMLAPRGTRYCDLSARAKVLEMRLMSQDLPLETRDIAVDKARFEAARAAYPRSRPLRIPKMIPNLVDGSYGRLASQGNLDFLRDLLQPA